MHANILIKLSDEVVRFINRKVLCLLRPNKNISLPSVLSFLLLEKTSSKISPITAITFGFALSILTWLIIYSNPTLWVIVPALVVFAIGEMTQAPRYYEYIANLAPKGQIGLFQGYAFLPIAMGWIFGGFIYKTFAKEAGTPNIIWLILAGVGTLAALSMWIYNKLVAHEKTATSTIRS